MPATVMERHRAKDKARVNPPPAASGSVTLVCRKHTTFIKLCARQAKAETLLGLTAHTTYDRPTNRRN